MIKFPTYYRSPALVLNLSIPCFTCGHPMERTDKNTYKITYSCHKCKIIIKLKLNESVGVKNGTVNIDNVCQSV